MKKIVHVNWISHGLIANKIVLYEDIVNVISAYALQVGLEESVKSGWIDAKYS